MTGEKPVTCLTGIKLISVDYRQKVAQERKLDEQIGLGNCAPDCALTPVYPRQIPSLTGKHRKTSFQG
jgi:hypothetical protein